MGAFTMSPSDAKPTLDVEWSKLKTKEDFYSPADFAVKKQYLSAIRQIWLECDAAG